MPIHVDPQVAWLITMFVLGWILGILTGSRVPQNPHFPHNPHNVHNPRGRKPPRDQ